MRCWDRSSGSERFQERDQRRPLCLGQLTESFTRAEPFAAVQLTVHDCGREASARRKVWKKRGLTN